MRKLLIVLAFCLVFSPVLAQKKKEGDLPSMVILPPVLRTEVTTGRGNNNINPMEVYSKIYPRLPNESKKRKWEFSIIAPKDLAATYLQVAKEPHNQREDYKFGLLKPLAEKLEVRYITIFAINQMTAYQSDNTVVAMAKGRANIEVFVYDREVNEYVWQKNQEAKSSHFSPYNSGSLSARLEHSLQMALSDALTPFSKGERVKVERPVSNVVATVQKVLGDGKRVLLDVGKTQNVGVGDTFKSIESDAEIKVVEVLENGSIAEITKGTPKEKEVFK